jgi:hypothetical protein
MIFSREIFSNIMVYFFQYAGRAYDELKHIRQAIGFLVIRCLIYL